MSPIAEIGDRRARILVVDDERDNRELLDVILSWEGFVVLTASSGEEALATVLAQAPDLILLDVMMPGMDGYDVSCKLKAAGGTRQIPIIIVTALADTNAKERGRRAGAEGFLAKPIDRDGMVLTVRTLFRATYTTFHE